MGTHLTDFNYQRLALNSRTKMCILNFCLVLMLLLSTGIKIANSLPQYDYSYDYEERWRLLAIDDTTYARDPRISVYYKQQPNRQYMVIRDVQMSDQGVYKCELSRRPDPLSIITTVDVFEKMPEVYYYDYVEAERISRE